MDTIYALWNADYLLSLDNISPEDQERKYFDKIFFTFSDLLFMRVHAYELYPKLSNQFRVAIVIPSDL